MYGLMHGYFAFLLDVDQFSDSFQLIIIITKKLTTFSLKSFVSDKCLSSLITGVYQYT